MIDRHDIGIQDDARMNLALALTAIREGADVLNYAGVEALIKDDGGTIIGAKLRDALTNEVFVIKAKVWFLAPRYRLSRFRFNPNHQPGLFSWRHLEI